MVFEIFTNAFVQSKKTMLCIGGAGLSVLALGLAYKYFRKEIKLTRVGVVSQLIIYPLKSGKGLLVSTAECQEMGLKFGDLKDRHWLVITEDGSMVTGRQEPRLVLVSLSTKGEHLCLNGPDMEELKIPNQQQNNPVFNCRVFKEDIQGRDCGDEASEWLTRYLAAEKPFRLVHFEPHMKPRRPMEKEPLFPPHDKVAYPDASPVMLLSETSVNDLNSRLEKDVTVAQFRPSIVVTGCEAFDEDSWDDVQIGSVTMHRVMACGRCIFTTVDPETGTITRKQPLETLKSYRQCDAVEKHRYKAAPLFGQYYSVCKTGVLQVGDAVYKIGF